jgi:hypothetical protein
MRSVRLTGKVAVTGVGALADLELSIVGLLRRLAREECTFHEVHFSRVWFVRRRNEKSFFAGNAPPRGAGKGLVA